MSTIKGRFIYPSIENGHILCPDNKWRLIRPEHVGMVSRTPVHVFGALAGLQFLAFVVLLMAGDSLAVGALVWGVVFMVAMALLDNRQQRNAKAVARQYAAEEVSA